MAFKKIIGSFVDSSINLVKNPLIILPSILLLIAQMLLFPIFYKLNSLIIQESLITHWAYILIEMILFLIILSFLISNMIFMAKDIIKSKRISIFKGSKYTFKTFTIFIIYIIIYLILLGLFYVISILSKYLALPLEVFSILIFIIYMLALLGVFMFISLPIFIMIVDNFSISKSIKSSILFVKKNYIITLLIFLVFFVLGEIVKLLSNIYLFNLASLSELISFLIIYPLIALVFTKIYLSNK